MWDPTDAWNEFLFPLAAAVNFFSLTGLVIVSGLFGKADLAADIAIIQGAILAFFLSLSGNARNIILSSSTSAKVEKNVFCFRLMIVVPASLGVYYLASSAISPPVFLLIALIVRKCSEWLAELQLANQELRKNFQFAARYILVNTISYVVLVILLLVPVLEDLFYWALYAWALTPVAFAGSYLRFISGLGQYRADFTALAPHMGSTVAIGVATYVFRVLVFILAGKVLAGQMFTAYALGGVMSSLYVYAVGPSLMLGEKARRYKLLSIAVIGCLLLGIIMILVQTSLGVTLYSPYFLTAIGYSLIGGGIMIVAQNQRLYILQRCNKDVFVPDAAANMLLISSIPFGFFIFGEITFPLLFLWSAVLHLLFYMPIAMKTSLESVTP